MDEILLSRIRKEAYEQGYQDGMVEGYNLAGAKLFKRKKGKWEEYLKEGLRWKCSNCGSRFETPYHFCPNCGAEME